MAELAGSSVPSVGPLPGRNPASLLRQRHLRALRVQHHVIVLEKMCSKSPEVPVLGIISSEGKDKDLALAHLHGEEAVLRGQSVPGLVYRHQPGRERGIGTSLHVCEREVPIRNELCLPQ